MTMYSFVPHTVFPKCDQNEKYVKKIKKMLTKK